MSSVVTGDKLLVECPKCAHPFDVDTICDNDCGTHYCEKCDFEYYYDARGKACAGHSPICCEDED